MFHNPDTLWLEIMVIIMVVAFFGILIFRYLCKKANHIPTGECASCSGKKNALLKAYRKKYKKI